MYFSVLICIAVESSVSPGNMDVILILPAGDEDRHGQEVLEVVNFYQRLLQSFFLEDPGLEQVVSGKKYYAVENSRTLFPERGKCMKTWILFKRLCTETSDSKEYTKQNSIQISNFLNRLNL